VLALLDQREDGLDQARSYLAKHNLCYNVFCLVACAVSEGRITGGIASAEKFLSEALNHALFEFRPGDAECCKFYKNCSILPLIIHYTDAQDHRRKDAVIVCSDDLGSNFKVHKHCMQKVLSAYLPRYCT
jgi:hypothetical protein